MKKAAFVCVLCLGTFLLCELVSAIFVRRARATYFSYEKAFLASATETAFQRFIGSGYFDAKLGWNNPTEPTRTTRVNCVGEVIEYNYRDGYRVTPDLVTSEARIGLFGESFTHGEEVDGGSTISAVLKRQFGVPTINFGVNGYDPLQAAEKLKAEAAKHPNMNVAVLSIMHENVWRVVTSFKMIYFPTEGNLFHLKPFVDGSGHVVHLNYPLNYPDFIAESRSRFKDDYWAKPEGDFPYSISMLKLLFTTKFESLFWSAVLGPYVHEYRHNEVTRKALAVSIEEFVRVAEASGIQPIVVFIPRNEQTYRVSASFVESMNTKWQRRIVHEFSDPDMDWNRYKIASYPGWCHPSAYGYGRLANYIHRLLTEEVRVND